MLDDSVLAPLLVNAARAITGPVASKTVLLDR